MSHVCDDLFRTYFQRVLKFSIINSHTHSQPRSQLVCCVCFDASRLNSLPRFTYAWSGRRRTAPNRRPLTLLLCRWIASFQIHGVYVLYGCVDVDAVVPIRISRNPNEAHSVILLLAKFIKQFVCVFFSSFPSASALLLHLGSSALALYTL